MLVKSEALSIFSINGVGPFMYQKEAVNSGSNLVGDIHPITSTILPPPPPPGEKGMEWEREYGRENTSGLDCQDTLAHYFPLPHIFSSGSPFVLFPV